MSAERSVSRYLNASAVADYLSISRNMVDILVERGVLPKPVTLTPRLKRWDRQAIDAALAAEPAPVQPLRNPDEIVRNVADGLTARRPMRQKAASGRH